MSTPIRVVSLVPSLTELLFFFDRGSSLVGRTRFCEEPRGLVESVPIVGGTKNPDVSRIAALNPDIVIANKEENRREDIEALIAAKIPVHLTDPNTLNQALAMIVQLGELFEASSRAAELVADVRMELSRVYPVARRVFVAVWREPLLGLGGESYGNSLLESLGAVNVLSATPRYPETTVAELAALKPDLILLPDEPYPFKATHIPEFAAISPARVIDGKLLWWYGPRMPTAIRELGAILNDRSDAR